MSEISELKDLLNDLMDAVVGVRRENPDQSEKFLSPDGLDRLDRVGHHASVDVGHRLQQSPDGRLVEIVELGDHPWFLGCQFHPEFKSKPIKPHPLFRKFIEASLQYAKTK